MRRTENRFLEQSHNKYLQIARDFVKVCPKCESNKIFIRNRKIPKYRCQGCGNEFDNPKAEIVHKTIKQHRDYGRQYTNPDK